MKEEVLKELKEVKESVQGQIKEKITLIEKISEDMDNYEMRQKKISVNVLNEIERFDAKIGKLENQYNFLMYKFSQNFETIARTSRP